MAHFKIVTLQTYLIYVSCWENTFFFQRNNYKQKERTEELLTYNIKNCAKKKPKIDSVYSEIPSQLDSASWQLTNV